MFEGVVGRNSLGNIAIDDVSLIPGVCPSKPLMETNVISESWLCVCTTLSQPCILRISDPFGSTHPRDIRTLFSRFVPFLFQPLPRLLPRAPGTVPSKTTPAAGRTPRGGKVRTSSTGRGSRPGQTEGSRRTTTQKDPEKVRSRVKHSQV